jgi:hypothetical protein
VPPALDFPSWTIDPFTTTDLRAYLLRFQIRGPLSLLLLQCVLQPSIEILPEHIENISQEKQNKQLSSSCVQSLLWHSLLAIPSQDLLPSHCVLALTVLDPRLSYPPPMIYSALRERRKLVDYEERELRRVRGKEREIELELKSFEEEKVRRQSVSVAEKKTQKEKKRRKNEKKWE